MLLKSPEFTLDNDVFKDIQILFHPEKHQARVKGNINGKELDIVFYSWNDPKISGVGMAMDKILGEELLTKTKFTGKIEFSLIQNVWKLIGKYGSRNVTLKEADPIELIRSLFNDIIQQGV